MKIDSTTRDSIDTEDGVFPVTFAPGLAACPLEIQVERDRAVIGYRAHDADCPTPRADRDGRGRTASARRYRAVRGAVQGGPGLDRDGLPDYDAVRDRFARRRRAPLIDAPDAGWVQDGDEAAVWGSIGTDHSVAALTRAVAAVVR